MKPNHETNDTLPHEMSARKRWMGVLARAETARLEAAFSTLETVPQYDYLRPPEIGMTMVRARAGGKGERFNLGEMTMTRCSVKTADGLVGHGYVAGRDKLHAELAAVFDALLQSQELSPALIRDIIDPLEAHYTDKRLEQSAKTAATRVNFFTMVRGED